MKKQTNWITIPDEKIHTPVSGKTETKKGADKSGDKPVANKILWGAGFAVLVVIAFALLAPSQFSSLLKGSLFDAAGVPEDQLKIDIVPDKTAGSDLTAPADTTGDKPAATPPATTDEDETSGAGNAPADSSKEPAVTPEAPNQPENVVKPEEEPVNISVEPVTPPVTTADCAKDIACFVKHLADGSLAKATYGFKLSDKDFESDLEITGSEGDNCLFTVKFTKSPETSLVDQKADCKIKKGDYKEEDVNKVLTNKDELTKTCTGDAVITLGKYMDTLAALAAAAVTPTPAPKTDEQAKMIADLKKQIDALQTQRKDDIGTMEDLANAAQDLVTHPAAGGIVPTSITSTANLGQPQALQPGFRVNPYKVTVTPQQMLQQNLSQGGQYAQQGSTYPQAGYQQNYQQNYQANAADQSNSYYQQQPDGAKSGTTPQTGPSEALLITFALTFLGLVGWKFMRSFA